MSDASVVLRNTADWLEANRWNQGRNSTTRSREDAGCLVDAVSKQLSGAARAGALDERLMVEVFRALRAELLKHLPIWDPRRLLPVSLAAWNDTPGRTKDEVIALVRAAALRARRA